jgi:hypothetical protein
MPNARLAVVHVNERDLQLAHAVSAMIESDNRDAIFLVQTKYTNLVRVNLVILKALLDDQRRSGLMITIDRPHQYLSHLMQLHQVDQKNLVFLDVISSHSSDSKGEAPNKGFQGGPFHIETLPDFIFSGNSESRELGIDVSKIEFVVIDNVSTLLTYNTMDSIMIFFKRYGELVESSGHHPLFSVVIVDNILHQSLNALIEPLCRRTIDVGMDMMIKNSGLPPAAASSAALTKPDISQGFTNLSQAISMKKEVM